MQKECAFCKDVSTGNDYNPLISLEISCGFLGDVNADVFLSRNDRKESVMTLGICGLEARGNEEASVPINYCPICGRALGGNKNG